ncbi:MAG: UDP-N-acetylmuramoyl-tripeptide--D-alanyl-D-alanine ligase [Burkholderiales bacterium]|nr:UDP-N-acetylmuramoyl-tripeptide--D-alanyl-D-alanine ligase [Burkholderiales bacterium]
MTLARAAAELGGAVRGADVRFDDVCTDSRILKKGDLFIALRGERYDGHDFVGQAAAAGAAAALVDRRHVPGLTDLPLAVVADTTVALGALAAYWRRQFHIPLVAVVGSNGKTTVKEMIAACLRAYFGDAAVLATRGNLNNHIGVPLTLLALREAHRVAVVEIGMNHPGETAQLAAIAAPTIAVINNAQREHQEFMRSVADVAVEHASLISALPADGVAVINADDAHAGVWRAAAGTRRMRDFGLLQAAAVSAHCRMRAASAYLEVTTPEEHAAFELPLAGEHNARNALAAIAAATAAGASLAACARALGRFVAVKGRLQIKTGRHGAMLIDDTYNANPDSVRAAIDVLARAPGRKLLVLGDMGEVGTQGAAFHEEVGVYARDAGIDGLYALGELAAVTARAFGAGARHYPRIEELLADVEGALGPQTALLVKGSRFMQMERVVRGIEAAAGNGLKGGAGNAA